MFRKPLLFLDHGEGGRRALDAAIGLSQSLHTRLTIVHAIDESVAWSGSASLPAHDRVADVRRQGRQLLAAARDTIPADLPYETQLVHAPRRATSQILELVTADAHDLLIVGCECRPAPGWHIFGCDAHRLVHHSPVPVLTITDTAVTTRAPVVDHHDVAG